MKIGFVLPGNFVLSTAGNGVRAQAEFQAEALERAGHEVDRMDPWRSFDGTTYDVVQFFRGGFAHYNIEQTRASAVKMLVLASIIDTNVSNKRYRLAARLGDVIGKIFTIPGVFRQQAVASDLVIVRSQHEYDRIVDGLGIAPDKVEIVLNGVNPPEPAEPDSVRERYNLPDEFLLHVSSYTQTHKNVVRLVEAAGQAGYPLVLAGSPRPGLVLDEIDALAKRFGNVTRLGFLKREELNGLYAASKVFCLPSTHEGTGLVALEAASYDTGVVITPNGGPPDYFLDLAEYVDPYSVDSIREALTRSWENPRGKELRQRVLEHLTWDQSAKGLVAAYQRHAAKK